MKVRGNYDLKKDKFCLVYGLSTTKCKNQGYGDILYDMKDLDRFTLFSIQIYSFWAEKMIYDAYASNLTW